MGAHVHASKRAWETACRDAEVTRTHACMHATPRTSAMLFSSTSSQVVGAAAALLRLAFPSSIRCSSSRSSSGSSKSSSSSYAGAAAAPLPPFLKLVLLPVHPPTLGPATGALAAFGGGLAGGAGFDFGASSPLMEMMEMSESDMACSWPLPWKLLL